jgi:hypothetical protein
MQSNIIRPKVYYSILYSYRGPPKGEKEGIGHISIVIALVTLPKISEGGDDDLNGGKDDI